ncbi:hypothetical protein EK0264_08160 [Epidermidibacterium keratini]|uniref:Uncharacterized protein n=1 Tax=Epidermidibacterium keratini TaxID=1891644 RepID=A0A7L4YMZ8_9ACTN|nr:hypothetical protein [Epidermidibacterium keratini]QHC00253.1 hypothetical protein EK0264_08160 [Epidermidibacterium keratini]
MTDARRPRHEFRDGDDGTSSNWREMYAALDADPNRPSRRRRRAAEESDRRGEPEATPDPNVQDSAPAEPAPAEPAPVDPAPDAEPVEPTRSEPRPVEPVEPAPVEPAPSPSSPQPSPVEPGPTEPPPSEPGPTDRSEQPTVRESIPAWQQDAAQPSETVETVETSTTDTEITDYPASDGAVSETATAQTTDETQPRRPQTPWPAELTGPEFGEPDPDDQPTSPDVPVGRGEPADAGQDAAYSGASPYRPRGDEPVQTEGDEAPTAEQPAVAQGAYSSGTGQPAQSASEQDAPATGGGSGGGGGGGVPPRTRSRHAAESSGLRVPKWAIGVAALVVVGLLAWLIIGLATGGDDNSSASSSSATSSASPTSLSVADLAPVICTGASYAFIDTGQSGDQMMADPASLEEQYPDATLSTVPGGCIAGSTATDEVVLALGPFTSIEEACSAGRELGGAPFRAYAGGATTGLTETPCP